MNKRIVFIYCAFLLILGAVVWRIGFPSLKAEREKLQERSKAVTLGYYLPDFPSAARTVIDADTAGGYAPKKFISYYKKARKIYPHLEDIPYFLGYFNAQAGSYDKALEELEKAVAINPHYFWSHYNLAVVYHRMQRYDLSGKMAQEAIEKDPQIALFLINRSPLYRQFWRYIDDPEAVITRSLREGYEDAFALLALNAYAVKAYDSTIALAAEAIQRGFHNSFLFLKYAGLASFYQNNYEQAAMFLQEAVQKNKKDRETLEYLAQSLQKMNKNDLAEQIIRQAAFSDEKDGSPSLQLF